MINLNIHPNAAQDLRGIKAEDSRSSAYLMVLIEQMRDDESFQDRLLDHKSKEDDVEVQKWVEQYCKHDRNLWRLKSWTPEDQLLPYRIVYAYIPPGNGHRPCYVVLAVVHRKDFNYEEENPISARIIADYDELL